MDGTGKSRGRGYLIDIGAYIGDICLINIFFLILYFFVYQRWFPEITIPSEKIFQAILLINFSFFVTSLFVRSRLSANIMPADKIVQKTCYSIILFMTILSAGLYAFKIVFLPATHITIVTIALFLLFSFWHLMLRFLIKSYRKKGYNYKTIILVGSEQIAIDTFKELTAIYTGYKVLGYFSAETDETGILPPYLGTVDDIIDYLEKTKVDEVYYTDTERKRSLSDLISYCEKNMIRFHIVPDLYRHVRKKLSLQFLETIPVLSLRYEPLQHPMNRLFKRCLDVTISLLVIIFILPIVYLIVAPIIKLTSSGPIHFTQKRTGFKGKEFDCLKFRSMRQNDNANKVSATKDDPRVTKIGAFMRKTSIDELPQFFNVLKGDMSIVGPRPHMLKHTEEYSKLIEKFMVRHLVKPGITGWAQVTGSRGETKTVHDMAERVKKDVWYIENWSLFLDLKIIVRTVINAVMGEEQAY